MTPDQVVALLAVIANQQLAITALQAELARVNQALAATSEPPTEAHT